MFRLPIDPFFTVTSSSALLTDFNWDIAFELRFDHLYLHDTFRLFLRASVCNILCIVDHSFHDVFNLAGGLVEFSFVLQTPVIRQNSNCFFHTAFDLVACSAHRTVLLLVKVTA